MKYSKNSSQKFLENDFVINKVSQETISKTNNIFNLNSDANSTIKEKKRKKRRPERLESPIQMLKYFISHTSLHGIKYSDDEELYGVERIIWILLVALGFYCCISVILQLYSNFQSKQTNIVIDEINYDIFHVPFPSVTICPGTRIDWEEAIKQAKFFIPPDNKEANEVYYEIIRNMSHVSFSNLYELNIHFNYSTLEILKRLNLTDLLLKVLPKCEVFMFNCSWGYETRNCCDLFELQKTAYGFCYAFNSQTTLEGKLKVPYRTHAYGIRSGLRVELRKDKLNFPPSEPSDVQNSLFMISHPIIYPSKARFVAFGGRYNVDIKFTSAVASPKVLELEDTLEAPCKYDNGKYRFENCLTLCQQTYIKKVCGCNPAFFFPTTDDLRDCNALDLKCVAFENENISEIQYSLASKERHIVKDMCNCPTECEYCNYDDYVIGLPYRDPNRTVLDVHFEGPMGVQYKREIVVSSLDMLVQLGGIFGLFLGGSLLTIMEGIYCFIVGTIFYVYKCFISRQKKKKNKRGDNIIRVAEHNEKRIYPLLDFPVVFKQNNIRY